MLRFHPTHRVSAYIDFRNGESVWTSNYKDRVVKYIGRITIIISKGHGEESNLPHRLSSFASSYVLWL